MTDYSDKYGTFFARQSGEDEFIVLHVEDGEVCARLDAPGIYPIGEPLSVMYEHPRGIRLTRADLNKIGIAIEENTNWRASADQYRQNDDSSDEMSDDGSTGTGASR